MNSRFAASLSHLASLTWLHLAIMVTADAASEQMLFDFQNESNATVWQVVNDDVMGGVSTSQFKHVDNECTVFNGIVSLQNNGGFASVRSAPLRERLKVGGAFVICVRGDGRRYKLTARSESNFNAPNHQAEFTTKRGEWEEHHLAFNDFVPTFRGRTVTEVPPLHPDKITSVGVLISDKQAGPFRLDIRWIKVSTR